MPSRGMPYSARPSLRERQAIDRADAEANAFAFELLMPEDLLRDEVAKIGGIDCEDEKKMKRLADKFRVSVPAMILRLGQLTGPRRRGR